MQYNKLVRDKIAEIIKRDGKRAVIHKAEDDEYEKALYDKLSEEVGEFIQKPSEEELADILEVIRAIYKLKDYDEKRVEAVRESKLKERGGFDKKIILDRIE